MPSKQDLIELFDRIATISVNVQRKVTYLLIVGFVATAYLIVESVSPTSSVWWNVSKGVLIALPVLMWLFVWAVLNGLSQAPAAIAKLANDESRLMPQLQRIKNNKPTSLRGVFSMIRAFRREEGYGILLDSVGDIAMITNPLFVILAFLTLPILLLLIVMALVFFVA